RRLPRRGRGRCSWPRRERARPWDFPRPGSKAQLPRTGPGGPAWHETDNWSRHPRLAFPGNSVPLGPLEATRGASGGQRPLPNAGMQAIGTRLVQKSPATADQDRMTPQTESELRAIIRTQAELATSDLDLNARLELIVEQAQELTR